MAQTDTPLVLVVDDHLDLQNLMRDCLQASGLRVICVGNGASAVQTLSLHPVELVVLDLNLPGCDGFEVCRQVRQTSKLPIIAVSARTDSLDKVLMLELGADDYLTKPFHPRELVARVQATLRRRRWDKDSSKEQGKYLDRPPLCLNSELKQARLTNELLELTPIEFGLLWHLALRSGENLSRQRLLDLVWGSDYPGNERTVDSHIKSLRKKMQAVRAEFRPIRSVWGVGYRYDQ